MGRPPGNDCCSSEPPRSLRPSAFEAEVEAAQPSPTLRPRWRSVAAASLAVGACLALSGALVPGSPPPAVAAAAASASSSGPRLPASPGSVRLTRAAIRDIEAKWEFPSLRNMALRKLNRILAEKLLPRVNSDLPELIREAGIDPMPALDSVGLFQLWNVTGLSSIRITSMEARRVRPFEATVELSAELTKDLVADGEVIMPSHVSQALRTELLHSYLTTAGAQGEQVPFVLRMVGLRIPSSTMYVLSNNMTAVDGVEIEATPIEYDRLEIECSEGLLGSRFSPARLFCTKLANKMARSRKEEIQKQLSDTILSVLQEEFDRHLPNRRPRRDFVRVYVVGAAVGIAGCAALCLCCASLRHLCERSRRRRRSSSGSSEPIARAWQRLFNRDLWGAEQHTFAAVAPEDGPEHEEAKELLQKPASPAKRAAREKAARPAKG
eukprot:TRINITY_DN26509_c0_g1_i1.p1 TRINITY_DN26509_c0_g1~~TRINITY_DN26509_c0_g1_i1.p1  ORF type:complete len:465 (+),score=98.94 TRINITY_DN26509_c0_g1_i1:83-1396(+)